MHRKSATVYIVAFIVLASPLSFVVSHETRMYSLLLFCETWTLFYAIRLSEECSARNNLLAIIFALMGLFSHYYFGVFLVALLTALIVAKRLSLSRILRTTLPFFIASAAFIALWGYHIPKQLHNNAEAIRPEFNFTTLPWGVAQIFAYPVHGMSLPAIAAAIGCLVLLGSFLMIKNKWEFITSLGPVTLGVELILLAAIGFAMPGVFNARFSILLIPPLALILMDPVFFTKPSSRSHRIRIDSNIMHKLAAAILVALSLVSVTLSYASPTIENWRGMVDFVETSEEPTDIIAFPFTGPYGVFTYYYRGNNDIIGLLDGSAGMTLDKAKYMITQMSENYTRVWYILYLADYYDPNDYLLSALGAHYGNIEIHEFGSVRLGLFY
jgi:hypothetical protein